MPLSEEAFTALVDAGCLACEGKSRGKKVAVKALVAQRIPLHAGEPYGRPSWGYKGEDLVRGTYRVACEICEAGLFEATACPRCESADGVERALNCENAFPLPRACRCGSELLVATAFVPAFVTYEGTRAEKARTRTSPEDPGFHAFRVECTSCHTVEERRDPCPLCGVTAA